MNGVIVKCSKNDNAQINQKRILNVLAPTKLTEDDLLISLWFLNPFGPSKSFEKWLVNEVSWLWSTQLFFYIAYFLRCFNSRLLLSLAWSIILRTITTVKATTLTQQDIQKDNSIELVLLKVRGVMMSENTLPSFPAHPINLNF
jgi:hypothetical protein